MLSNEIGSGDGRLMGEQIEPSMMLMAVDAGPAHALRSMRVACVPCALRARSPLNEHHRLMMDHYGEYEAMITVEVLRSTRSDPANLGTN